MSDPVPAITEAAATGQIAAIFADIRNVLGVDIVNLIWRHLATIEGALPWAWGILRPLYADGSVGNEAKALRAALMLPPAPSIPAEVFAGLGLRPHDLTAIRGVLILRPHQRDGGGGSVGTAGAAGRAFASGRRTGPPVVRDCVVADRAATVARPRRNVDRHRRTGDGLEPVRHAPSGGGAGQHVSSPRALAVLPFACLASARTDGERRAAGDCNRCRATRHTRPGRSAADAIGQFGQIRRPCWLRR